MSTCKVAIACQGGGTHAAFTWGVLGEILRARQAWGADREPPFDLVALSGTSAGALCALAAWYGLAPNAADPECGTFAKSVERLDTLWTEFAARTPTEQAHNAFTQGYLRLKDAGLPLPGGNPYGTPTQLALNGLAALGARQEYLGFAGLLPAVCPHFDRVDWARLAAEKPRRCPRLVVGAVEIASGNFEVFDSEESLRERGQESLAPTAAAVREEEVNRWRVARPLSLAGVAASGTLPEVLPAQVIPGQPFPSCHPGETVRRDGYYWDGLYSQNPPVRDLLRVRGREHKPHEIWVVRINPQEYRLDVPDLGPGDIHDRVNALAGNLSLNQELDHILSVNKWLRRLERDGGVPPALADFRPVTVRTIKMRAETARRLKSSSKLDRSPEHLAALREEGRAVAREWLDGWRAGGDAFPRYPDDARYAEFV